MDNTKLPIPFTLVDWDQINTTQHNGTSGNAYWKTLQFSGLRIRIVEYTENYIADHWCQKGHIVHCLEGEVVTEQEDGSRTLLKKGMTYIVSDNASSHRSVTKGPVKLLIVDGDFLNPSNG